MSSKGISPIPPRPTENGQPFPDILEDAWDIEAFIETYATYAVDEDLVIDLFRGKRAVLKLVPISDLQEGGRDANMQIPANERKYERMGLKTIPPLLVENGKVLDGNHRLRANKKRGITHMWCYVVELSPEEDGMIDL